MQLKRGPRPSPSQADGGPLPASINPAASRKRAAAWRTCDVPLLTTFPSLLCVVRRPAADERCSPPTSRRKSGSTGRPTIRSRWCSRSKGLLEKEFAKDGIAHPLGADARLQQGAGIPQRRLDRFRLDRRLGGAGLQDQRQSDQVDLRLFAARMDRAGHAQGHARSPRSRTSRASASR